MLHRDRETLRELARSITADLRPSDTAVVNLDYRSIITLVVQAAVDAFGWDDAGHSEVLDLIDFCLEFEALPTTYEPVLKRILSPPEGITINQHLSKVLIPLLHNLPDTLMRRGVDFKNSAFERFAAAVIREFAVNCMPEKPPRPVPVEQLQAIGCTAACKNCMLVREFAVDTRDVVQLQAPQNERFHVERQLKLNALIALGFTWETIRSVRPYIIKVSHCFSPAVNR